MSNTDQFVTRAQATAWADDVSRASGWPEAEFGIDYWGSSVSLQYDGQDVVQVVDIDEESGKARVVVFASTDPDAPMIFQAIVDLHGHHGEERICGHCDASYRTNDHSCYPQGGVDD